VPVPSCTGSRPSPQSSAALNEKPFAPRRRHLGERRAAQPAAGASSDKRLEHVGLARAVSRPPAG
jgi:hypothetical protein